MIAMSKSLTVRLVKEGEPRKRATVTYTGTVADSEWLKLRNWLEGKDTSTFPSEQLLTVNVVVA